MWSVSPPPSTPPHHPGLRCVCACGGESHDFIDFFIQLHNTASRVHCSPNPV